MTAKTKQRSIESVEELVPLLSLVALREYEVSGKRTEAGPMAKSEPTGPVLLLEPKMDIQIMENHNEEHIESRFRATVDNGLGVFLIDVGLMYKFSEPIDLGQTAIHSFIEKVAIMAAWPFIREGIATTAARMELPVPVLGLMKQGQASVQLAEPDQDN